MRSHVALVLGLKKFQFERVRSTKTRSGLSGFGHGQETLTLTNDFDPSSLATMSTWEAKTWCALLCRIDLEPQGVSARAGPIYEI